MMNYCTHVNPSLSMMVNWFATGCWMKKRSRFFDWPLLLGSVNAVMLSRATGHWLPATMRPSALEEMRLYVEGGNHA